MQRRELLGVLGAAAGMAILPESMSKAQEKLSVGSELPKESVAGIGGFFFRAKEAEGAGAVLSGLSQSFVTPQSKGDPVWNQQAGPDEFQTFP